MRNPKLLSFGFILVVVFISCRKDDEVYNVPPENFVFGNYDGEVVYTKRDKAHLSSWDGTCYWGNYTPFYEDSIYNTLVRVIELNGDSVEVNGENYLMDKMFPLDSNHIETSFSTWLINLDYYFNFKPEVDSLYIILHQHGKTQYCYEVDKKWVYSLEKIK